MVDNYSIEETFKVLSRDSKGSQPKYFKLFTVKERLMGNENNPVLKTEWSERFEKLRKNAMVMSFYKYGPLKDNYGKYECMEAVANLKKRLAAYEETGNTEFLADVANFAMIEFMFPKHPNAHFKGTDSGAVETVGTGINEILREAGDL